MAWQKEMWRITVTEVDDDGAKSTHAVHCPKTTDGVAVANFAAAYGALVAGITDGALIDVSISQRTYDDSYPTGEAGSDVENKGVLIIQTSDNSKSVLALPAIDEEYLVDSGVEAGIAIDITLTPVANLITALLSGISVKNSANEDVTVSPTDDRGFDFVTLRAAYKQNRRSQKRRRRQG
jgi:hypothetical protein